MRPLLVAVALVIAAPAFAADTQPQPSARVQKRVTANHYWTLEKMLRRFSRQAGEARTRG